MTDWLIFAATGAFAGLMAGLFGVGGGLIMVPILALLLPFVAWYLGIGLWDALVLDISFALFYVHIRSK